MSAGETGLVVTDENGKSFLGDCPKLSSGERVLFSSRIKRLDGNTDITAEEREKIISKLMELAPETKWKILK
jgi:hypothetical protein